MFDSSTALILIHKIVFSYYSGDDFPLVNHPPHSTPAWSSALIPFCYYRTKEIHNSSFTPNDITFPFCSAFLPTILDGQLCYKLTLNKTSGQGKKNELMLLLDYNDDHSVHGRNSDKEKQVDSLSESINFDLPVRSLQSGAAKIQIGTLSPFVGFGGGMYKMTAVKRMTAKSDFLEMSQCTTEEYEDCRTRMLVKECNDIGKQVGTKYFVG